MELKPTAKVAEAIALAQRAAQSDGHAEVTPAHLVSALVRLDTPQVDALVTAAGTGAAHVLAMADKAEISGGQAKEIFEIVLKTGRDPNEIAEAEGLKQVSDTGAIETAVGLGIASPKTRKLALGGLVAYGLYMAVNVARNR